MRRRDKFPRPPVAEALADELRKKVEERRRGTLCLCGVPQTCVYMIQDIQDPEELCRWSIPPRDREEQDV